MKRNESILLLLCILLFAAAIRFHTGVADALMTAGTRCVLVIIPSLYLFSVLASFCIRTGLLEAAAQPLTPICRKLLHMDGIFLLILLFSQFAGYPVGTQLLRHLHDRHPLPAARLSWMLCCCFGCGPAFLLGTVCAEAALPRSIAAVMMLSVIFPNLLLGIFLMRGSTADIEKPCLSLNSAALTAAVESGVSAMLKICSMILLFAALGGILRDLQCLHTLTELAASLLRYPAQRLHAACGAVFEISSLTEFLRQGGSLPAAAALLSFGGICVHFQNAAICGGDFPWRKFLLVRIACACCTYWLCRGGLYLTGEPAYPAFRQLPSAAPVLTQHSLLPLLCLLVMAMHLLCRLEGLHEQNAKIYRKISTFANKSLTNDGK